MASQDERFRGWVNQADNTGRLVGRQSGGWVGRSVTHKSADWHVENCGQGSRGESGWVEWFNELDVRGT